MILGGGLTGISAAMHLAEHGRPWLLVEKNDRLGGHARTDETQGFRFDKTGHWLHLRDDYTKALIARILPDKMTPVARKARIFSSGVLTRFPFQANLHGLPPEIAKECLLGFIQAHEEERAQPDRPAPANFEEFCLRHFGPGISRHFMIPYNAKLWGVHPREITAEWCSRFVPRPKLDEVVSGAVGANPPELGYNISFQYPKKGGIETMTRALIKEMKGGEVALATGLDAIDLTARKVQIGGEWRPYRAVVMSIPLPEFLKRVVNLPPEIEQHAARLRCTTLRYLNLATKSRPKADFHWIYVPEEKYPFYRVGIYTNAVPSMAPRGKGSFYVELSDRGARPDLGDITRQVAEGLAATGALKGPDDVLFTELKDIEYAYVVFDQHYYAAVNAIRPWLEAHDVFPRGRYGFWTYNAMEDCILAGREVAATIEARLAVADRPIIHA